MVRHNKEYEEGKVSRWRKVTELYDLTAEEREVALNLGNISDDSLRYKKKLTPTPQVSHPKRRR